MKLPGRWIETAGFEPGSRVRITVECQRLIITPLNAEGPRTRPFCHASGNFKDYTIASPHQQWLFQRSPSPKAGHRPHLRHR
ncbi:SymE family type I addiction module toxin [Paraburkholderia agricolaris]|uniref:SymE family type I addiction module toxin n=1 Tax=Paraburkholderia agricolaris TaxID=2152888 RepID=UPI0031B639B8